MENSTPPTSQGADDAPTIPSTKAQAFSELPRLTIPSPDNPKPVLVSGPDRTSQSPESASSRAWSALSDSDSITAPAPSFGNPIRAVRPPRPISKDYPRPTTASTTRPTTASTTRPMTASTIRPMTASTKRMSMSSIASKKTIKYGTGKHARVELVPQPSDDPEDPLNWPMWRRNLNFFSLLYMTAIIGVMKTMLVTANSTIAMTNGVSYTAAVALTAVPLMMSGLSGMVGLVIAKVYGKRPVYLFSTAAIFIGLLWSAYVKDSYAQNMTARIFQGLGWGAFDTLVIVSLQDTFFEHELDTRVTTVHIVSVATTWGGPLLGGIASASSDGFTLQSEILGFFMAAGVWLVLFGVPETSFEREGSTYESNDRRPITVQSWPYTQVSKESVKAYISLIKLWSYKVSTVDSALLFQAPRAAITPTTLLLIVVSLLPYATLWSFVSSLSMMFSVMPFMLSTGQIGAFMLGPFMLASIVIIGLSLPAYRDKFTPNVHSGTLAMATAASAIGTLGFGLYVENSMTTTVQSGYTAWGLDGTTVSLPTASFLLGLLAAGSVAYEGTVWPVIRRSTAFTSANLPIRLRNTADMNASLACLKNFVAGIFVIGIPDAVYLWEGLKSTTLGLGISQIFIGGAVCFVWWRYEQNVKRLDGRTLGVFNLAALKENSSFFDFT